MGNKSFQYLAGLISAVLYIYFFYWLERHESGQIALAYTALFAFFLYLYKTRSALSLKFIIGLAISFRLLSLASIPPLSDDFYRFIWDGIIWSNGVNPFAFTPLAVIEQQIIPVTPFVQNIYDNLNAQVTYTVYPTIPQVINLLAFKLSGEHLMGNIITQRLFIIATECLSIFFILRILKLKNWDSKLVILYALNPLVILELSGNLHHEALMIAFLLGFLYLDIKGKTIPSALMLTLSVGAKLLPLMFYPFLILRSASRLKFGLALGVGILLIFFPLIEHSFINGMTSSLTLYYQKFEFNAGLYFVARELGYWYYGYNAIALIGQLFLYLALGLVLLLSLYGHRKKFDKASMMTLIYLAYALLSLILHPWYILLLIALAPLTKFRFSLVWSFLIFFTYLGYTITGFHENYLIVGLEYFGLAIALFMDWRNQAFTSETLKEAP